MRRGGLEGEEGRGAQRTENGDLKKMPSYRRVEDGEGEEGRGARST